MPSPHFAEEITKAFSEVEGSHKSHPSKVRAREGSEKEREPGMGMRRGVKWAWPEVGVARSGCGPQWGQCGLTCGW